MKKLISEKYEHLNDEGRQLDRNFSEILKPLINEYVDNGYSTIEIEHVLVGNITLRMAEVRMKRGFKIARGEAKIKKGEEK